jgi:hypothetical protein
MRAPTSAKSRSAMRGTDVPVRAAAASSARAASATTESSIAGNGTPQLDSDPGQVAAADIIKSNGAGPKTVNGLPLDITVRDGKVYVNGVQVVTADVQASNGVIHVIDAVLLPQAAPAPAGR